MPVERLGDFRVRGHASLRDPESGRFMAEVDSGARAAVSELAETLADLIRTGMEEHLKQRTGKLLASVEVDRDVSRSTASAVVGEDYASPIETGSRPHWIPNAFGRGVAVWWYGKPGRGAPPGFRIVEQAVAMLHGVSGSIVRRNMSTNG